MQERAAALIRAEESAATAEARSGEQLTVAKPKKGSRPSIEERAAAVIREERPAIARVAAQKSSAQAPAPAAARTPKRVTVQEQAAALLRSPANGHAEDGDEEKEVEEEVEVVDQGDDAESDEEDTAEVEYAAMVEVAPKQAQAEASPRQGPHERVRNLLRRAGEEAGDEEEDMDEDMERMLEMCREHLIDEAHALRKFREKNARKVGGQYGEHFAVQYGGQRGDRVDHSMRSRLAHLDSVYAARLEEKVTAELDRKVGEIQQLCAGYSVSGSTGGVVLNSGVNRRCSGSASSSSVTGGPGALPPDHVDRRWRNQAPWTGTPRGRAAKIGGGVPRSEALRRSASSGSGVPAAASPQGAASPRFRLQARQMSPAGKPSPGRDKQGRMR